MIKHKYVVTYRTYNGPEWQDYTVIMEGDNPFHAFEVYRKANPLPLIWASQILSIVRQL